MNFEFLRLFVDTTSVAYNLLKYILVQIFLNSDETFDYEFFLSKKFLRLEFVLSQMHAHGWTSISFESLKREVLSILSHHLFRGKYSLS